MKLRKVIIVLTFIGIVVSAVLLSQYFSSLKEPPAKEEVKITKKYVNTIAVSYMDVSTEVTAFGRVRASESLDLIAEIQGRMFEGAVRLKEGQKFKKGDLLFRVDDLEAKLNLQSQKSIFLRDLAAILPDFKIDYPNNFNGWQNYFRSIDLDNPLPKLPDYKSDKEKTFLATKNIFSSYYTIKSVEAAMRKYKLYAPFNGTISEVVLQSGSYVNPGNKIAKIYRTDRLELKVDVGIGDIGWIKNNQSVAITSEDGNQTWNGKITRIGDLINQNTQSLDVFVDIKSNGTPVYDGLYLQAIIPGKVIKNAMEIPRSAVFNGNQVFVVRDTVLKVNEIMIHKVNQATVIFSGLTEGDDLVFEPLINAYNNMRVYKLNGSEDKDIDLEKKNLSSKLVNN